MSKKSVLPAVNPELVFVDTTTHNYQPLLDEILASAGTVDVVVFDSSADGVSIISSALSQYQNIHKVHIISPCADCSLPLGSSLVDQQYLNEFSGIFSSWSDAFSAHADIRIYGHDAVASASRNQFFRTLGRLTGTDVATSEEATRRTSLGADWSFECRDAAHNASLHISAFAQHPH